MLLGGIQLYFLGARLTDPSQAKAGQQMLFACWGPRLAGQGLGPGWWQISS